MNKKAMNKIKLSVLALFVLVIGCTALEPIELPDEYIACENRITGESLKYEEDQATKYPDAFCVVDTCVTVYVIYDVYGKRWNMNEHQIRDQWVCEAKTNK